jgi:isochorismate hydrolase
VGAVETYDVRVMGKEDVDYGRSALIVWDMQNGIARNAINFDQLLRNVRTLIDTSHTNSIQVIYSQHTGLPSEFQSKYMRLSLQRRGIPEGSTFMAEGSQEWRIVKELDPDRARTLCSKSIQQASSWGRLWNSFCETEVSRRSFCAASQLKPVSKVPPGMQVN